MIVLYFLIATVIISKVDSHNFKQSQYEAYSFKDTSIGEKVVGLYKNPCKNFTKHCFFCPDHEILSDGYKQFNKTVCYSVAESDEATVPNGVNVTSLLQDIDVETTALQIVVDNKWQGYYPLKAYPVDLTPIHRLTNLELFELSEGNDTYLQPYPLKFENSTFQNLTKLKILKINLPLVDQDLQTIVEPLYQLEILNLSFTRGVGMASITNLLRNVNSTSLMQLFLDTFQLIGGKGYQGSLDLTKFLSNRTFPNLKVLSLSENSLFQLLPGITRLAPSLEMLDLSGNILLDSSNLAAFMEASLHPSIQLLDLGYQGYIGGGTYHFRDSGRPTVHSQQFTLQENLVSLNSKTSFLHLINKLILNTVNEHDKVNGQSNISSLMYDKGKFLKTLQALLPDQFNHVTEDFLPNYGDLYNYSCMAFLKFPFGPNLREVFFNHIHWEESVTLGIKLKDNMCFRENNLTSLVFSHNSRWLDSAKLDSTLKHTKAIYGLEKLTKLQLDNNDVELDITVIGNGTSFPNMEHLDLSGNHIYMQPNFRVCDHMKQLTNFNLNNNRLKNIPESLIAQCHNLKVLNLGQNHLKEKFFLDLNNTEKLEVLDLSSNKLAYLSLPLVTRLETWASKANITMHIDLTGNPLSCRCDNKMALDFIKWINNVQNSSTSKIMFVGYEHYYCEGPKNNLRIETLANEKQFQELMNQCPHSNLFLILITVTCTAAAFVVVILGIVGYRNRWLLKYKWFKVTTALSKLLKYNSNDCEERISYKYDAFVSYCADDRFWVHDALMKTLEEQYSFKLCIHYRDFPVGEPIAQTIANKMLASRELIVVISDLSLQREWCRFELEFAVHEAEKRKKKIIVIKMGSLGNRVDSESAARVLDTHTHLEWTDNPKGQKLFWAKLVGRMYGDDTGCCVCCCPYGAKAIKYQDIYDDNSSYDGLL